MDTGCAEKTRLIEQYQSTTEKFAHAVTQLTQTRGTSPLGEYQRLMHLTEEARLNSERARIALEAHVTSHHC